MNSFASKLRCEVARGTAPTRQELDRVVIELRSHDFETRVFACDLLITFGSDELWRQGFEALISICRQAAESMPATAFELFNVVGKLSRRMLLSNGEFQDLITAGRNHPSEDVRFSVVQLAAAFATEGNAVGREALAKLRHDESSFVRDHAQRVASEMSP